MFREKLESMKKLFKNENLTEKKKIQNLVFFLILLVVTVIAINFIWSDNNKNPPPTNTNSNKQLASDYNNVSADVVSNSPVEYNLQSNLEGILSNIKGAGKVKVLITYSESGSIVPIYNESTKQSTTEEKDTSGRNQND